MVVHKCGYAPGEDFFLLMMGVRQTESGHHYSFEWYILLLPSVFSALAEDDFSIMAKLV